MKIKIKSLIFFNVLAFLKELKNLNFCNFLRDQVVAVAALLLLFLSDMKRIFFLFFLQSGSSHHIPRPHSPAPRSPQRKKLNSPLRPL